MKKQLLIIVFLSLSHLAVSQKTNAIGIDFGNNIFPLLNGSRGFAANLILQVPDSAQKNTIEYVIGISSFDRAHKSVFQKNRGFCVGMGKVIKKNSGWHIIVSVDEVQNTFVSVDTQFNKPYEYDLGKEIVVAVGGEFFCYLPIKLSNRFHTSVRLGASLAIGTNTKNAESVFYRTGLGIRTGGVVNFGFGLSVPLFLSFD
jgi:hypothetical protein